MLTTPHPIPQSPDTQALEAQAGPMDDEQREIAIKAASEASMGFLYAGNAHMARVHLSRMEELIKGRSKAQVAAMEREYFGWRGEQDALALAQKELATNA